MSNRFFRVVPLILLPLAAGCSIAVPFEQNRPPVPLISHQGELVVSGGAHWPFAPGFDYQVVYAPVDHISTYAAMQFDKGRESIFPYNVFSPVEPEYNNRFYEVGLGYFDTIPRARYEAYLLAGFGNGAANSNTLNVFRIGVQQNFGVKKDIFGGGVGLGLGYEHLYNLRTNFTDFVFVQSSQTDSAISSFREISPKSSFYIEPIFFCSVGTPIGIRDRLFTLRCQLEIWLAFTTNSYSEFGGGNAALAVSFDF